MTTCPNCQATTRQQKAGKNNAGLERYHCQHCQWMYTSGLERESNIPSVEEQTFATQAYVAPAAIFSLIAKKPVQESESTLMPMEIQGAEPLATPLPITKNQRPVTRLSYWASSANAWGILPEIAVLEAAGLLLLAWAFTERRAVSGSAQSFLWIGLAALILPVAMRLASVQPARRERIGLVLLLGMTLYLVKVMYSPLAFTFPDELSHIRNVNEILVSHHLFGENPVLPVTAYYPGLPIVTSSLSALSHLSTFTSGIVVIGFARLILMLALFLLFEQISGSARIASLGALVYMANPNFLYWLSEYAYEPLALPLVIFVLLAVAKAEMAIDRRYYFAWTVAALLGLLTVVITHHVSSYIVTGLLIALVILHGIRSRGREWGPWIPALIALAVTYSWLNFVAHPTVEYLSRIFLGTIEGASNSIAQREPSRALFTAGSSGKTAPLWEQSVAIGSTLLIALGLPFGLYVLWKNHRNRILALLLAAIALLYLPMQLLRLTKGGWETANRSSEFLYIGIGFVLALGIGKFWISTWSGLISKTVLAALAVMLFFGGLIAGWPPRARWPRPYVVSAGSHVIQPQVVSVAESMLANLGPDHHIAASRADAKILSAYNQYPFSDTSGPVYQMFMSNVVEDAQRETLLKRNIEYIVLDRKMVSWDHMIGYYFYSQQDDSQLMELSPFVKFDGLAGVNRVLDAGDIIVYDVRQYLYAFARPVLTSINPIYQLVHP